MTQTYLNKRCRVTHR